MREPFDIGTDRSGAERQPLILEAGPLDGPIVVPGGDFLLTALYSRQGDDLLLAGADGRSVLIEDYFALAEPPALRSEGGARIDAALVAKLAPPPGGGRYAQAGGGPVPAEIGEIRQVEGTVQIRRAGGGSEAADVGDKVYRNDEIVTGDGGNVGIRFTDGTIFTLSDSARMVLDELVYNGPTQPGSLVVNVLQGTFAFVTGAVAKTGPDAMVVQTPVAMIGVRGTTVAGQISVQGEISTISLLPDADGTVGRVAISNAAGLQILDAAFESIRLASYFAAPPATELLTPDGARNLFGDMLRVLETALRERRTLLDQQGPETDLVKLALALGLANAAAPAAAEAPRAGDPPGAEDRAAEPPPPSDVALALVNGPYVPPGEPRLEPVVAPPPPASPPGAHGDRPQQPVEAIVPPPVDDPQAPRNLVGGSGSDLLQGGDGNDRLAGGGGNDVLVGGGGDDLLLGGDGDDLLDGGDGDDRVFGEAGDDTLVAGHGGGNDLLDGGGGIDTVTYTSTSRGIVVDLAAGTGVGPEIDRDTLVGIENVTAGDGDDVVLGDGNANVLLGGRGNDRLSGRGGDDRLEGGAGDDIVDGGAGNDRLVGGPGNDVAAYRGAFAEYDVARQQATVTVADRQAGRDGTDTLDGIETLRFADGDIFLDGRNNAPRLLAGLARDLAEDTPLTLGEAAFVATGRDFDGDALRLVAVGGAVNGRVALDAVTRQVTFTPDADFNGAASFTYTLADGRGGSVAGTVRIAVAPVNDAPLQPADLALPAAQDAGALNLDVLAGVRDPDSGDRLRLVGVDTSQTLGQVTLNPNGTLAYDPAGAFDALGEGESTVDRFTYTVADSRGLTTTGVVAVTVSGRNDAPVTADDIGGATDQNSPLVTANVLANDFDIDSNDTLAVVALDTAGTQGRVVDNGNGTFTYDPDGHFVGLGAGETAQDSFRYTVGDGKGGTATAAVIVTVTGLNDAPVAVDDAGGSTDGATPFVTADVLLNDSDPDTNDGLSVVALDTSGTLGLVVDNGDGTFAYDPNGAFDGLAAGQTAQDTFRYTVADGNGGTAVASVFVTIFGPNALLTAVNDAGGTTDQNTAFVTANVLANDVSSIDDLLTVTGLSTLGTRGQVTDRGDGTFLYDPNGAFDSLGQGQVGIDRFRYTVADEHGGTAEATVEVAVTGLNDSPIALSDFGGTTAPGVPVRTIDVLANDSDPDIGDTLSVAAFAPPSGRGDAVYNGDGTFTYTPRGTLPAGGQRLDTFSYTVADQHGATAVGRISILVTEQPPTLMSTQTSVENHDTGSSYTTAIIQDGPNAVLNLPQTG